MVPYYSPYPKTWGLTPKLSLQHAQKPSYSAEGLQDTQNTSLIFWAKIGVFLKDRSSKHAQNSLHMSKACRNIERDIHLFRFALTHLSLQAIRSKETIRQKKSRFWARTKMASNRPNYRLFVRPLIILQRLKFSACREKENAPYGRGSVNPPHPNVFSWETGQAIG